MSAAGSAEQLGVLFTVFRWKVNMWLVHVTRGINEKSMAIHFRSAGDVSRQKSDALEQVSALHTSMPKQ